VVVGTADELVREDVRIDDLNWLAAPPAPGDAIRVQVRHRATAVPARVVSVEGGTVNLVLDQPQRAITPGQSAVMFSGDVVLGGGRIAA
jgi:tRNA-specific 2-thiouridylase